MSVLMNIGLDSKHGPVAEWVAREAAARCGFAIRKWAVFQSDTEATLVVEASLSAVFLQQAAYRLAADLSQDCIAVYVPDTQQGALVGPKAAAWGPFNPAFFIKMDGQRLA